MDLKQMPRCVMSNARYMRENQGEPAKFSFVDAMNAAYCANGALVFLVHQGIPQCTLARFSSPPRPSPL